MKKNIISFVLLLLTTMVYAQRQEKSWSIQARAGLFVKDFNSFPNYANVGLWKRFKGGYFVEANYVYNDFKLDYEEIPYKFQGASLAGGWSLESLRGVFLNFRGGAFLGNEKVNELNSISQKTGAKLPYDNTKPVNVYGFLVGGEVEVKLYRNFSFLFGIEEYWYKSSKYADWNFGLSSGLKCYL